MQHQPTDEQLSAVGIDRINDHTSFEGTVNYVAVYEFAGKATALRMCDKMRGYMDVRASCLLYTSPSPRDLSTSRMPSSA